MTFGLFFSKVTSPATLSEMLRHATPNKGRNARRYQAGGHSLFFSFSFILLRN